MSSAEPNRVGWLRHPLLALIGYMIFGLAVLAVSWRAYQARSVPGQVIDSRYDSKRAFGDFHDAVYFPVRAVLTGVNPYSAYYQESFHPDGHGFPLFAPVHLLLHAPIGLLQLPYAEIAFLIFNLLLTLIIAALVLRLCQYRAPLGIVALLAGLMILSRPGILNFYGMQVTLIHVIGCLLALEWAQRKPVWAGMAMVLAASKPTFLIPLAALMFFRGNWRAVWWGVVAVGIANAITIFILAGHSGGLNVWIDELRQQYFSTSAHPEIPEVATSWTRIDAWSIIPRWTDVPQTWNLNFLIPVGILMWGACCVALERDAEQRRGALSRTGLLTMLVVLASLYHQPYDCLLLWVPIFAIAIGKNNLQRAFSTPLRWVLLLLLMIPMYNFFGTRMFLTRFEIETGSPSWQVLVTVNAMAIAAAAMLVGSRILLSPLFSHDRDAKIE